MRHSAPPGTLPSSSFTAKLHLNPDLLRDLNITQEE